MTDIARFEGDRVQKYDDFISTWMPQYGFMMDLVGNLMHAETKGERHVLVAGFGTGNEIRSLLGKSPDFRITGVDPSPDMLPAAKAKLADWPQVNLQVGHVADLPADSAFDGATLILVLHFLPDDGAKLALLRDIATRLRPGAPFFITDITGAGAEFQAQLRVIDALLPPEIPEDVREARYERLSTLLNTVPAARLEELLLEAGFVAPVRCFQAACYAGWWARKG